VKQVDRLTEFSYRAFIEKKEEWGNWKGLGTTQATRRDRADLGILEGAQFLPGFGHYEKRSKSGPIQLECAFPATSA
jgi:hypothetical protein